MQAMSSNPLQFHSAQADPRITLQRSSNRFSARPSSYDEIVLKRGIDQPGSIRSLKYAGGWTRPCTRAYDYPPESRAKCRIRFALQTFARIIRSTSHELGFAAQSIRRWMPVTRSHDPFPRRHSSHETIYRVCEWETCRYDTSGEQSPATNNIKA